VAPKHFATHPVATALHRGPNPSMQNASACCKSSRSWLRPSRSHRAILARPSCEEHGRYQLEESQEVVRPEPGGPRTLACRTSDVGRARPLLLMGPLPGCRLDRGSSMTKQAWHSVEPNQNPKFSQGRGEATTLDVEALDRNPASLPRGNDPMVSRGPLTRALVTRETSERRPAIVRALACLAGPIGTPGLARRTQERNRRASDDEAAPSRLDLRTEAARPDEGRMVERFVAPTWSLPRAARAVGQRPPWA
jgi:hypothetical protein